MKLRFFPVEMTASTLPITLALRQTFCDAMDGLGIPHYVTGGAWTYLQSRYSEPQRHYHNLYHLADMFNASVELGAELTITEVLAIFYHDIIYEIGAKNNEERSAKVFERLIDYSGACEAITIGTQIIRDTARFLEEDLGPESENSLLVMDLDLAGLADEALFDQTNACVRREFDIDMPTHAKFLQNFLHKPFIYRTGMAWEQWESRARTNIHQYVEKANSPVGGA